MRQYYNQQINNIRTFALNQKQSNIYENINAYFITTCNNHIRIHTRHIYILAKYER